MRIAHELASSRANLFDVPIKMIAVEGGQSDPTLLL
jgi:hypothetical protein